MKKENIEKVIKSVRNDLNVDMAGANSIDKILGAIDNFLQQAIVESFSYESKGEMLTFLINNIFNLKSFVRDKKIELLTSRVSLASYDDIIKSILQEIENETQRNENQKKLEYDIKSGKDLMKRKISERPERLSKVRNAKSKMESNSKKKTNLK